MKYNELDEIKKISDNKSVNKIRTFVYTKPADELTLTHKECNDLLKFIDSYIKELHDHYDAFNPNSYEEFSEDEELDVD